MPDFILFALAGGLMVAAIAGPLGTFIVWQRLAYYGDTLAHSALLGIAIGLILEFDIRLGILATCLLIAAGLTLLQRNGRLPSDTVLGVFSHSSLALGLVAMSLANRGQISLENYLLGDILTISQGELLTIGCITIILATLLVRYWNALLAITVHAQLAEVEGTSVQGMRFLLMTMIAILVAIAMKVVGVLLITALLILPASIARHFSGSPEKMAILASLAGVVSVFLGVGGSFLWDTPTGPSIVVAASGLLLISRLFPQAGK